MTPEELSLPPATRANDIARQAYTTSFKIGALLFWRALVFARVIYICIFIFFLLELTRSSQHPSVPTVNRKPSTLPTTVTRETETVACDACQNHK